MVVREGKGRVNYPTKLCYLERIYMAHECDLGWPTEGNALPNGAHGPVTATVQGRSTHTIAVDILISSHAYRRSPSWREQLEPVDIEPRCPSNQF
jgi:hypothetical protein